jgi:hypothetical protein
MEHRTDLGRATVGCNNTTKFSEVQTVASRNSLYRILAINVALGVGQRAKMQLYTTWIGLRKGPRGGDCYRELPRILIPRTWVNKGKQKDLGGVTTKGRRSQEAASSASSHLTKRDSA